MTHAGGRAPRQDLHLLPLREAAPVHPAVVRGDGLVQVFLPVMRREAFRDRTIYREATVLCAAGDLCRIQLTDTEQTMWVRVSTLVHPRTAAQLAERALEE